MAGPQDTGDDLICPLCLQSVREIYRSRHGRMCWVCFETVDPMYAIFDSDYKWWEAYDEP